MMPKVPKNAREAEDRIDELVRSLPMWSTSRDELLRAALDAYRDAIEIVFLEAGRQRLLAEHLGPGHANFTPSLQFEHGLHLGAFWVLKWALAWCPALGEAPPKVDDVGQLFLTASTYQALADALWMHKHGWGRVEADLDSSTLTVFEGGDLTGQDERLADYLHATLALHHHDSFTADDDKLTSRWCAGDFRDLGRLLREECDQACSETVVVDIGPRQHPLFKRPVVLTVPSHLIERYPALFEDLTLRAADFAHTGGLCWRVNNWFDRPFVEVGGLLLCPSNVVQAVFKESIDAHLLRAAAATDPDHYVTVSQAREHRMTDYCVDKLRAAGWSTTAPLKLTTPEADVDIHAERDGQHLLLELKSTIRPESPREVASRNEEIHSGLEKSEERRARFPNGTLAAVVTDGYRGDYRTWSDALARRVPVVTTREFDSFIANPARYVDDLIAWVSNNPVGAKPLAGRETDLLGWRFIAVDAP